MAAATEGRAIFISYRRDDTEGETGRLYDDLVRAYSDDSVFMDVSGIQPGLDFRKAIDANVATCGVLLAVIGPTWASVTDAGGQRRLDNSNDFVRLEIASALARSIAVIPVLVHGAKMPALDLLPDDLKDLRYRNSVELTHARWNSDVALLVAALKSYVTVSKSQETQTVHATIPVQLPAPGNARTESPTRKSKLPLLAGLGIVVVAALAAGGYFAMQRDGSSNPKLQQAPSNAAITSATVPEKAEADKPTSAPVSLQPPAKPTPKIPVASPVTPLLGKWQNSKDVTVVGELTQLTIANFGGRIMVHAWGKCQDRLCDWGTKTATMQGSAAVTESWELRNTEREKRTQRSASLSLTPTADGLQVAVHNTYHQPNGETKEAFTPLEFVKNP